MFLVLQVLELQPCVTTEKSIRILLHGGYRGKSCEAQMLRHIFSCRAKRAKAGQGGDPSLYFMVLDVVEESGGAFQHHGQDGR